MNEGLVDEPTPKVDQIAVRAFIRGFVESKDGTFVRRLFYNDVTVSSQLLEDGDSRNATIIGEMILDSYRRAKEAYKAGRYQEHEDPPDRESEGDPA